MPKLSGLQLKRTGIFVKYLSIVSQGKVKGVHDLISNVLYLHPCFFRMHAECTQQTAVETITIMLHYAIVQLECNNMHRACGSPHVMISVMSEKPPDRHYTSQHIDVSRYNIIR